MFEPLEHWREFYLLIGTAAAAMVALLFVAASIGAGYLSADRASKTRVYMSPVVVHFTAVLVASILALVPSHTRVSLALLVGAGALGTGIYSAVVLFKVVKDKSVDWEDRSAYGIVPVICYTAGLIVAGLFFVGSHRAPEVLAGTVTLLLIDNVRNAWDLMLFLAGKHGDPA